MAVAVGRLVVFALGLVFPVSGVDAVSPIDQPGYGVGSVDYDGFFGIPQPRVKGTPSLIKFQDPLPDLLKRDCLANGTNYCFGNNANYCSSCGICCTAGSSKYCCPAEGVCCGDSCCGKGQTCNSGKCFQPPVTVTVGSTVVKTVTHSRTQTNTVGTTIFLTSTINSVIESTITSGATETNWQYVTVTTSQAANGKRSYPTANPGDEDTDWDVSEIHIHAEKRKLDARQEATGKDGGGGAAATTTVEAVVTQTKDITGVVTTEVASTQTSTILTTIFQTKTKVLNALTTVSPTSTLTILIRPPSTTYQTHIATEMVDASPTAQPTDPSLQTTAPTPSQGLSTPTVAGIAVGSAVFALLLILAVFFLIRHRRRAAARKQAYEDACMGLHDDEAYVGPGYGHMSLPPPPMGAVATLPIVADEEDGAKKGSFTTTGSTAASTPYSATQAKFLNRPPGHHRSSSGFTGSTAVTNTGAPNRASAISGRRASVPGGTPSPPAELGQTPAAPAPAHTSPQQPYLQELYDNEDHQHREAHQIAPAEMMAGQETARYEVDGGGQAPWFGGNIDGTPDHDYGQGQGSTGHSGRRSSRSAKMPPAYRDF